MSNFKSIHGKWSPAHEKVGLINKSDEVMVVDGKKIHPGEPFVYEGPDRVAKDMLEKEGVEFLGVDFRTDPEFRQSVRNQGFENVDDYLKSIGFDEEKDRKEQIERTKDTKSHTSKTPEKEIKVMGGGKDQTGNKENDMVGGFGEPKDKKPDN